MESKRLILLVPRALQLLFAVVVLGVSISLAAQLNRLTNLCQEIEGSEDAPNCKSFGLIPAIEYSAFVGAFGLLDALVGLVSVFIEAIPWMAVAVLDGLAAVFYLAGGIRLAVLLSHIDFHNATSYQTRVRSDAAFLFLGLLVTAVLIGLGFMWQRGASRKIHTAV